MASRQTRIIMMDLQKQPGEWIALREDSSCHLFWMQKIFKLLDVFVDGFT